MDHVQAIGEDISCNNHLCLVVNLDDEQSVSFIETSCAEDPLLPSLLIVSYVFWISTRPRITTSSFTALGLFVQVALLHIISSTLSQLI
jgi:hypothetical protein